MTAVRRLPADAVARSGYGWWLAGSAVSLLGSSAQGFALGWSAAGYGGSWAALVLTATTAPRLVLALFGGAVADRYGPWRVLVGASVSMLAVMAGLAVAVAAVGIGPPLLLAVAVLLGAASAFQYPAAGSVVRHLAADRALGRAMAANQVAGRASAFVGPALGGLLVAALGLLGTSVLDAASYLGLLGVLVLLRGRLDRPGLVDGGGVVARIRAGIVVVAADRLLRALLALVAVTAGCLLPIASLLVPLLVRQHGWPAATAGWVVGAEALGVGSVIVLVLLRGTARRAGVVLAGGLLLAGFGAGCLAFAGSGRAATGAAFVLGLGTGAFTTHIGPLLLRASPTEYLSRIQAVLLIVQTAPLLLTLNVFGWLADRVGAGAVVAGCAVPALLAGLCGLASRRLRGVLAG
ncbi:hypothetical protein Athai_21080 [Actinocatenispora thailandica]|uniref:Major facilitator superfamily (MFS) profile domain-containing protein n=1 Tax=Actinocatenispora thailandica TaxID=227318 RepID=A0A7R7DMW0_9ACTN|nr:MFS transporter [Actinocatenispora thailandica]BCJ34605.1 hypothetical protein Athai_21080 [Actinocatenispora thailandica]